MSDLLRIATRKSDLALWQAHWVQAQLQQAGIASRLVLIETQGDREYTAFRLMQGQGFFTKAVQDAVLAKEADIAVHSLKDLPSARLEGMTLAAIPCRADARDKLLIRPEALQSDAPALPLKEGIRIGTSAVRRQEQLRALRPDLAVHELRGNVPTRLQKLRDGEYDAILLACAGLDRLALDTSGLHTIALEPAEFIPAPGQGALAIECRSDDAQIVEMLQQHLHNIPVARCIEVERGLMARLDGGCQLALGAYARFHHDDQVELLTFYQGQRLRFLESPDKIVDTAFAALQKTSP